MKGRFLTSIVFSLSALLYLSAINPTVRNFNRKVSKAGTQNWCIVQHKNDWMYFANNKGLLEFDGNRWTTYPIKNYTNVRSLLYDESSDRIYAGAFNEFGYYSRNEAGVLSYTTMMDKVNPKDRVFNEIWKILKIDNGLYFQGDREVFRYKDNQMNRFTFNDKIGCSGGVNGTFYVSTFKDGIMFLSGSLFMKLPNADILKNKKVCAILPFFKNQLLFVTEFSGMFVFNGESVSAFKSDLDGFLAENQIFCATMEGSKLALGTVGNGLVVKDFSTGSNLFSNTFSGMQNNTILSMAFDHQHNLWLGLDKGIDYVLINSPIYDLIGNSQLYGAGYASLKVNNTLYLGTNQGLYATAYPVQNSPKPLQIKLLPGMQGQVWSLVLIENTLFCGNDHGAYIIDGNGAKAIPGVIGTWNFKYLQKHPGVILGCSYQGFFILKKEGTSWKFSNFVSGFTESGGMYEEDSEGYIWFNHWIKGITRMKLSDDLTRFEQLHPFGVKQGLPSDRDNTLYRIKNKLVFSTQNGFYEFDAKTKSIVRSQEFESALGHRSQSLRLSETPEGNLWGSSFAFIAYSKQQEGKCKVDSMSFCSLKGKLISGFENFNFISKDNVIVSTEDGFSWIDLTKVSKIKSDFKVSIRNVFLTNENDSLVGGYQAPARNRKMPEFDFDHNSVRFEFVAPEYRNENSVTYSYFLENCDTKWSAYSPANTKEYTKLKKGVYTFRVRAKSLLEPNVVETTYQFVILPPWYETNIAYGVYLFILICLIYALLRFVKIRSEQGAREMEARKELEMKEQERRYEEDATAKKKEIMELKNQRLQYDLRHKSQELANSTMNLIRKNEILMDISQNLNKVADEITANSEVRTVVKQITRMQDEIKKNIEHDNNWKRFAENFDLVYENYLKRLSEKYPMLTVSDKKLCAYLKMDLSSKDIAPLMNMSFRSVEMSRYRLRKKMGLERDINLSEFLQNF